MQWPFLLDVCPFAEKAKRLGFWAAGCMSTGTLPAIVAAADRGGMALGSLPVTMVGDIQGMP